MRFKIAACALLLTVGGFACQADTDGDLDTDVGAENEFAESEFMLTGTVIDVEKGATPTDFEQGASPEATGADTENEFASIEGGIALRPDDPDDDENLEECETVSDAYVTFYTDSTEGELTDDDTFPNNLLGQRVTLELSKEENVDCLLLVDSIEAAVAADDAGTGDTTGDGTGTGAEGTAAPNGSPVATPFEGEEVFPPHEDTDPIFEGTPDPDECEGQKACRNEPGMGQPSS